MSYTVGQEIMFKFDPEDKAVSFGKFVEMTDYGCYKVRGEYGVLIIADNDILEEKCPSGALGHPWGSPK